MFMSDLADVILNNHSYLQNSSYFNFCENRTGSPPPATVVCIQTVIVYFALLLLLHLLQNWCIIKLFFVLYSEILHCNSS